MRSEREYEMNALRMKEDSLARGSSWGTRDPAWLQDQNRDRRYGSLGAGAGGRVGRWLDSFRRDPTSHITPTAAINTLSVGTRASDEEGFAPSDRLPSRENQGDRYFDLRAANIGTANSMLSRS